MQDKEVKKRFSDIKDYIQTSGSAETLAKYQE